MLALHEILWFALAALALGFTPGPNMAYCLSCALCQGRLAGLISLCGVLAAHGVYALATALGLTAILLTTPGVFDGIRWVGATSLLWLAWKMLRPVVAIRSQLLSAKPATVAAMFCMGFMTNLLNSKTLLFYVALFPQFLKPERGTLVIQSLPLGAGQIATSGTVMGLLVCGVACLKPLVSGPRYMMGDVLAALALRLMTMQIN